MASLASSRAAPVAAGMLSVVAVFAALEGALRLGLVNRFIVPLPSEVLASFGRIVAEEEVLERTRETAYEVFVAGLFTILIGVPIGAALYRWRPLRNAMEDWIAAVAAAPLVLAFPLFLVMFGRSPTTVIVMSVITGLAPMILKTTEGFAGTRRVLLNVGKSLKMTDAQMFWKILFPSALPLIFTGVRLSWTFVLISVVGVEFLINLGGLGQLINELAERYDLPGTYAAITFVVAVSVVFFVGLERLESWLRPAT
jgi:ABC-type nitrate/sulfonate/bicarbonate transport system permease component